MLTFFVKQRFSCLLTHYYQYVVTSKYTRKSRALSLLASNYSIVPKGSISFQTVRNIIIWFDPKMSNYTLDSEKEYGVNCWDITVERLWSHVDWFAFGHYWGWGMKALVIRHYGICWSVSIMWELTEVMARFVFLYFLDP